MIKNSRNRVWMIAASVGLAAACSANASWTQLSISDYTDYRIDVWNSVRGTVQTYATAMLATRTGGAALPTDSGYANNHFTSFCLDIRYWLSTPNDWSASYFPNTANGNLPSGGAQWVDNAAIYRAADLYNHYVSSVDFTTPAGKLNGAGLQLAIWEVLYEPAINGYDLKAGADFHATSDYLSSAAVAKANSMLTADEGKWARPDPNITRTFWSAVDANGVPIQNQDLIGPPSAVPEPSTVVAGCLLLLPFLASTLRRRA